MRAQGLDQADPAVATLREQNRRALQEAAKQALGTDLAARLAEYERTLPTREFVGSLAAGLVFAGEPLTSIQASRLGEILAVATESYQRGQLAAPITHDIEFAQREGRPAREPIDVSPVLAQARAILSPAQFERLEAELMRLRAITQVYNLINQSPGDPVVGFTIVGRK